MKWSPELGTYVGPDGKPFKRRRQRPTVPLWVRLLCALLIFSALKLGWESLRGGPVEDFVVHTATVDPAARLVDLLTPGVHARADHSVIRSPQGSLNIINGCDGTEALFILLAALTVAPIPFRLRVLALFFGVPFVFVVNEARIIALFYANRAHGDSFELLHATVTPLAVVLLVSGYFYLWLAYADRKAT